MQKQTTSSMMAKNSTLEQIKQIDMLNDLFQCENTESQVEKDEQEFNMDEYYRASELKEYKYKNRNLFAGIGQSDSKRLLTFLKKKGYRWAAFYKSILDLESSYIMHFRYFYTAARYYYIYQRSYLRTLEIFINKCQEQSMESISLYYYKIRGTFPFEHVLVAEIPQLGTISYFADLNDAECSIITEITMLPQDINLIPGRNIDIIEKGVLKMFPDEFRSRYNEMAQKRKEQVGRFYSCWGTFLYGDKKKPFIETTSKIRFSCFIDGRTSMIDIASLYKKHSEMADPETSPVPIVIGENNGLYCLTIDTKNILNRKQVDSCIAFLHKKLIKNEWYLWCGVNGLETKIFIMCYLPMKFETHKECQMDIALLYSTIGIILADKLNIHINQLFPDILCIESCYNVAFGPLAVNGDFDSLSMKDDFKTEEEYYMYLKSKRMLNPYIIEMMQLKMLFPERQKTPHQDENNQDVDDWICSVLAPYANCGQSNTQPLQVDNDDEDIYEWAKKYSIEHEDRTNEQIRCNISEQYNDNGENNIHSDMPANLDQPMQEVNQKQIYYAALDGLLESLGTFDVFEKSILEKHGRCGLADDKWMALNNSETKRDEYNISFVMGSLWIHDDSKNIINGNTVLYGANLLVARPISRGVACYRWIQVSCILPLYVRVKLKMKSYLYSGTSPPGRILSVHQFMRLCIIV